MGILRQGGIIKASTALPNPIPYLNMPLKMQSYVNHSGTSDNFMYEVESGNATANTNAGNHEMIISSGTAAGGTAQWRNQAVQYDLAAATGVTRNLILGYSISDVTNGVGVNRHTQIGFSNDFLDLTLENFTGFYQAIDNSWHCVRGMGGGNGYTDVAISAIVSPDSIHVICNMSDSYFYVNGNQVAHIAAINATDMLGTGWVGAAVTATAATVSSARKVGVTNFMMDFYSTNK